MGFHQRMHVHEHEARMRGFGFPPVPPGPPGPPFPPGPHGHGGGRGGHRGRGRGRRPNVRAAVLALLTERPMHGYEMIQELDSRTGGAWRPSPGSIYPTLQLLEDEGVVTVATEEAGGGRKRFTVTEAGRAEADEAAQAPPWGEFAEDTVNSWHDIRDAGNQAMQALRQVMTTGTDDQRERAAQVLAETRRKLYAILAESD
ncbi:PadR family transcriptional regulator [Micromonospora sp. NBC_01412]|uniref:PadR family transcriptional regulator n=1 Tax=Micromonospora sp. NBC_01412 TaxID=2903590 RepID=UPI003253C68A